MKTIICGSGDVGYSIADKLSKENFEVTVVDEPSLKLNKISENLDVKVVTGIPSLPSVLFDAVAKDCEILIAVTKTQTNQIKSSQNKPNQTLHSRPSGMPCCSIFGWSSIS